MEDLGHKTIAGASSTLRIAQFTDLHQWPAGVKEFEARGRVIDFDKENYSSDKNVELIKHALEVTKPDLCIFTGDILDGRPCKNMARDKFKEVMMDVLKPLIETNTQWTFCPGNHDDDHSPWSREDMLEIFKLPLCISSDAKTFDFTFTIGRGTTAGDDSVRIWMFDSGRNSPDPKIRYTTFSDEAVEGYKNLSKSLPSCGVGLAYFHIPLPEYEGLTPLAGKNGLFDAGLKGGVVPFPFNYQPFTSLVRLLKKDLVAGCSRLNSNIFEAFVEQGNVLATFCGHDHHSDFVAKRDNVYLCYGRCGGFTPPHNWEGAGGNLAFDHGARIVSFCPDEKKTATYVCTFKNDNEDYYVF